MSFSACEVAWGSEWCSNVGMGCRFVLGEGMTKKSSDLASEVEEQTRALQTAAADKKEAAEAAPPAPEPQGIKDEDVPDIKVSLGNHTCVLAEP